MHILEDAINKFGGTQKEFAEALGKPHQSYVSMLLIRVVKHGKLIPADICPAIERATKGKIKRHQLRPDLFEAPRKRAA